MKLTDTKLRNLAAAGRHFDGRGRRPPSGG